MIKDIFLILVGALIGLLSTLFVEHKKRLREYHDRNIRGKQLLKAIVEEIRIGIERCNNLSRLLDEPEPKISFSRIYTGLWDSTISDISKSIDDIEILRILNSTYYYFDLVNFNMNRGEFGVGAAFAKDKLPYLNESFVNLETKLKKYPETILFNTPTLDKVAIQLIKIVGSVFQARK